MFGVPGVSFGVLGVLVGKLGVLVGKKYADLCLYFHTSLNCVQLPGRHHVKYSISPKIHFAVHESWL